MALARVQLDSTQVAVFNDENFIQGDQAASVVASIEDLGHSVSTFDGTTVEEWNEALSGVSVVVVPEMFWGSFQPDAAVTFAIRLFVADGGTLIVNSTFVHDEIEFVNSVFNTSIAGSLSEGADQTSAVGATTFEDDPTFLPDFSDTDAWQTDTLPEGAQTFYASSPFDSTVFGFQHGLGQVIMLGWNWEDAAPEGTKDGGWLDVLESSISLTDGNPSGKFITGGSANDKVSTTGSIPGQPNATAFDDIIALGDGNDEADGGGGDDFIAGANGKDRLNGGEGDDVLGGGAGKDILKGGNGVDEFLFVTNLKKGGLDKLPDFSKIDDHLVLSQSVFKRLDVGLLAQSDIDKYFDVSGSGKVTYKAGKTKIAFAKLPHDELDEGDIIVIA